MLVAGCSQAEVYHILSVAHSDVSCYQSCRRYALCMIIYLSSLNFFNISRNVGWQNISDATATGVCNLGYRLGSIDTLGHLLPGTRPGLCCSLLKKKKKLKDILTWQGPRSGMEVYCMLDPGLGQRFNPC